MPEIVTCPVISGLLRILTPACEDSEKVLLLGFTEPETPKLAKPRSKVLARRMPWLLVKVASVSSRSKLVPGRVRLWLPVNDQPVLLMFAVMLTLFCRMFTVPVAFAWP